MNCNQKLEANLQQRNAVAGEWVGCVQSQMLSQLQSVSLSSVHLGVNDTLTALCSRRVGWLRSKPDVVATSIMIGMIEERGAVRLPRPAYMQ
jgi:hypothetical protein